MRLNHDCVRDVMLFIEEEQELGMAPHLPDFLNQKKPAKSRLDKYDAETIKYSLMKLDETNYLNDNCVITQYQLIEFDVTSITWNGHKFLDTIRDPKIWKTTKNVASHLESISITLLSNIASNVLESYIQKFIPKV